MGNPFEDDGGLFFVLVNRAYRFSIWPASVGRPQDWPVAFGPGTKRQCTAYAAEHHPDEDHHPGPVAAGRMPPAHHRV